MARVPSGGSVQSFKGRTLFGFGLQRLGVEWEAQPQRRPSTLQRGGANKLFSSALATRSQPELNSMISAVIGDDLLR